MTVIILIKAYSCVQTSYVTVPPEVAGWRSVTLQMAPFAESIQTVRGPCCENAMIFEATSCQNKTKTSLWMYTYLWANKCVFQRTSEKTFTDRTDFILEKIEHMMS